MQLPVHEDLPADQLDAERKLCRTLAHLTEQYPENLFFRFFAGLCDARERVRKGHARLRLRGTPFRDTVADVAKLNKLQIDDSLVHLDVGGKSFRVPMDTIARIPMLSALVSGGFADARQPDGSLFVDRDPDVWADLFNAFRKDHPTIPIDDQGASVEADRRRLLWYLGLDGTKAYPSGVSLGAHVTALLDVARLPATMNGWISWTIRSGNGPLNLKCEIRFNRSLPAFHQLCIGEIDLAPMMLIQHFESEWTTGDIGGLAAFLLFH